MSECKATCQRTGKNILIRDGILVALPRDGTWSFVCQGSVKGEVEPDSDSEPTATAEGPSEYPIPVAALFESPDAFFERLAQLRRKPWFRADEFMSCLATLPVHS